MSGEHKAARKAGDPMTPEGAKARVTTSKRGGDIKPERTKARMGGDPMSNTMPNKQVDSVIVGPQGDSRTLVNPVK